MRSIFRSDVPLSRNARVIYLAFVIAAAVGIGALVAIDIQQRDQLRRHVNELAKVTAQVDRALCLRKGDLEHAITQGRIFLRQHPHGTVDFSRQFVLRALRNDRADLVSLNDVRCRAR